MIILCQKDIYMKSIIIALGISLISVGVSAQAYRWVDDQGQVHYSSMPPASVSIESKNTKADAAVPKTTAELAAREIEAQKAKQVESVNTAEAKAPKQDTAQKEADAKQASYNRAAKIEAQQHQQQVVAACDSMRKDLATFENQPRVRTNVNGVIRRLTTEELNAKIAELKQNISENCQ